MGKPHRRFGKEFEAKAVRLGETSGRTQRESGVGEMGQRPRSSSPETPTASTGAKVQRGHVDVRRSAARDLEGPIRLLSRDGAIVDAPSGVAPSLVIIHARVLDRVQTACGLLTIASIVSSSPIEEPDGR